MMKRMVWIERGPAFEADQIDTHMREIGVSLPEGTPSKAWKRETANLVEICAELFPGSTPIWIWEEQ